MVKTNFLLIIKKRATLLAKYIWDLIVKGIQQQSVTVPFQQEMMCLVQVTMRRLIQDLSLRHWS